MGDEPSRVDLAKIILDGLRAKGYDIDDDAFVVFCNMKDGE